MSTEASSVCHSFVTPLFKSKAIYARKQWAKFAYKNTTGIKLLLFYTTRQIS